MRGKTRVCGAAVVFALTFFTGGCVDPFLEGLSRGFADGVAFVVEDFITQLPGHDPEE